MDRGRAFGTDHQPKRSRASARAARHRFAGELLCRGGSLFWRGGEPGGARGPSRQISPSLRPFCHIPELTLDSSLDWGACPWARGSAVCHYTPLSRKLGGSMSDFNAIQSLLADKAAYYLEHQSKLIPRARLH